MKLKCEVCNCSNILKINGVFVCQNCGVKYSLDEVKSLLSNEDENQNNANANNPEIEKLYMMARLALKNENNEEALSYYNKIYQLNPLECEAMFYRAYITLNCTKVGDIPKNIKVFTNVTNDVFTLIGKETFDDIQIENYIKPLVEKTISIINNINSFVYTKAFSNGTNKQLGELYYNLILGTLPISYQFLYKFGQLIQSKYEKLLPLAIMSLKYAIQINVNYIVFMKDRDTEMKRIETFAEYIRKYDKDYNIPRIRNMKIQNSFDLVIYNADIQLGLKY